MSIRKGISNCKSIHYNSGGVERVFTAHSKVFQKSEVPGYNYLDCFPSDDDRILYVDDGTEISCSAYGKFFPLQDIAFIDSGLSDILVPDSQIYFRKFKFPKDDVYKATINLNGARYVRFNGFSVTFTPRSTSDELKIISDTVETIDFGNMIFYGYGTLVLDCPNLKRIWIRDGLLNQRYHVIPEGVEITIHN